MPGIAFWNRSRICPSRSLRDIHDHLPISLIIWSQRLGQPSDYPRSVTKPTAKLLADLECRLTNFTSAIFSPFLFWAQRVLRWTYATYCLPLNSRTGRVYISSYLTKSLWLDVICTWKLSNIIAEFSILWSSGLWHRVNWYMGANISEENTVSFFRVMEAIGYCKNVGTHLLVYTVSWATYESYTYRSSHHC
jgi:hypothetical protein